MDFGGRNRIVARRLCDGLAISALENEFFALAFRNVLIFSFTGHDVDRLCFALRGVICQACVCRFLTQFYPTLHAAIFMRMPFLKYAKDLIFPLSSNPQSS